MTVLDNVLAGLTRLGRATFLEEALRIGRFAADRRKFHEQALQIIRFLHLEPHINTVVSLLPYGLQKRVDLAALWSPGRSCCCSTSRWPA